MRISRILLTSKANYSNKGPNNADFRGLYCEVFLMGLLAQKVPVSY
jgi:hypothetical protein